MRSFYVTLVLAVTLWTMAALPAAEPPRDDSKILEPGRLLVSGTGGRMAGQDWNGDGKRDLIVSTGKAMVLLVNEGTNAEPVFDKPQQIMKANGQPLSSRADGCGPGGWYQVASSLQVVDLNGDGKLDLNTFLNVGAHTKPLLAAGPLRCELDDRDKRLAFMKISSEHGASPQYVDWNGDGKLDKFVGGQVVRINVGTKEAPKFDTSSLVWLFRGGRGAQHEGRLVDWNGDGKLDLIVNTSYLHGKFRYYENVGTKEKHKFAAPKAIHVRGWAPGGMQHRRFTVPADLDGDGTEEIVTLNGGFKNKHMMKHLYLRGGLSRSKTDPRLGGVSYTSGPAIPMVADWNGDGKLDIISSEKSGRIMLLINGGTAMAPKFDTAIQLKFEKNAPKGWVSTEFRDMNGDGTPDLCCLHVDGHEPNVYYVNTGTKSAPAFDGTTHPLPRESQQLGTVSGWDVVDWNGDGDMDLLCSPNFIWKRLDGGTTPCVYMFLGPGKRDQKSEETQVRTTAL